MPLSAIALAGLIAASPRIAALRAALEARIAAVPGAEASVVYRPLGGGAGLELGGGALFHAASTMKLAVLIELFRRVDQGEVSLDQGPLLVNRFRSIVDGSSFELSPADDSDSSLYARLGTQVTLRDLADRMIARSSNLATNALVARLGADRIQATARALGARTIEILRGVEDAKAYARGLVNRTSALDLAALLESIEEGRAASKEGCRAMRQLLLSQQLNELIPAGLPPGTPVAHKTGNITATLHDAAIVYPLAAAPYVLVVLTRAIPDERAAVALISSLSRLVYEAHAAR